MARDHLGIERLRPGQAEAVGAVLRGQDTLAVMSTGYGKSAIYQITGMMLERATVVVSPLIALQRDQVGALDRRARGGAAAVSSQVSAAERREALDDAKDADLEFLFLAPEQLSRDDVLADIAAARPSLLVVDEAHCISEWGHDFRPDYLKLGAVRQAIGRPTVLALTATASPPVRREIVERLGMRGACELVRGFNRENLWLGVERFHDEGAKRRALLDRVRSEPKPGIVYTATRRTAEEVAEELRERGVAAVAYHGGMNARARNQVQEAFMADQTEVIVATTAFGMGVDKPNVRFVFHHDIADSVDSHYQEVGRAGRDGAPARAILFYRPQDLGIRRFFAGGGNVGLDEIARVAEAIGEQKGAVDAAELRDETDLSETKLTTAVSRLEDAGAAEVLASGEVAATINPRELAGAVREAAQEQLHREEFDRSRIEMIRGYAELADDCLREYVLNYFGEQFEPPCGNCQNCDAGRVAEDRARPFPAGSRVAHGKWGEGVVQRYEGAEMVVLFDSVGYKTLGIELVLERDLLEPAPD